MERRTAPTRTLFTPRITPEVCVVEASAGSGKTHALAMRYLALLLDEQPIDDVKLRSILAITFTNRATVEMKGRILAYLKALALGWDAWGGIPVRTDLGLAPATARARAERALSLILQRYASFQIQTIDSFVNRLVSGAAFPLRLAARFEVEPLHEPYLAYSLEQLVARAAEDDTVRQLFERFVEQYLLIEQRGGWQPRAAILEEMENLFAIAAHAAVDIKPAEASGDAVFPLKAGFLVELHQLSQLLPPDTDQRFAKSLAGFLEKHLDHFQVDDLSNYFTRERFPVRKNGTVSPEIQRRWDRICTLIRRIAETEAYAWYSCYTDLFDRVYRGVLARATADDTVLLAMLNRTARGLFEDGGTPVAELYLRIAARHRHLLIDEFQDTSDLQWRNLEPLVKEALSTGGTLFYVGDKKQAIYRFRGGDVRLFDTVREQFRAYGARTEHLSTNYRSKAEIVRFNNDVFSRENLERFVAALGEMEKDAFEPDLATRIHRVFADACQQPLAGAAGGYVIIERVDEPTAEERAVAIRALVRQRIADLRARGFAFRDIAVLVRSNDQVETVSAGLLAEPLAGGLPIPVCSDKTLNVQQHPLVKEVLALLSWLGNPTDDIAFAGFITGQLAAGAEAPTWETLEHFFLERRGRYAVPLYRIYADEFPAAWERVAARALAAVERRPLYEFLVWLLDSVDAWGRFPDAAAYFAKLLELIANHEDEAATPTTFLNWLAQAPEDELFVATSKGDAVTVTTIHKAKGLQFPAVICPFLTVDWTLRNSCLPEPREGKIVLVRATDGHARFSPTLARLRAAERTALLLDELNTVYVALTRAQEELSVIIPCKVGNAHNLARMLIPECLRERGTPIRRDATSSSRVRAVTPRRQHGDWLDRMQEDHTPADRIRQRENARAGDLVHAMLAAVEGTDAVTGIERVRTLCGNDPLFERCAATVRRVCTDPSGERFFPREAGARVFAEREITDETGRTWRVDRMVVRDDAVDVVDFKTSMADDPTQRERQRRQVLQYAKLVAALYPDKDVRAWVIHCPIGGPVHVERVEGEA